MITKDDLRVKAIELIKKGKTDDCARIIKEVGKADRIAHIKPENLEPTLKALNTL